MAFKEQLQATSAFIYRRGLQKNEIHKETISFESRNIIAIGKGKSESKTKSQVTVSLSHILCDLLDFNRT